MITHFDPSSKSTIMDTVEKTFLDKIAEIKNKNLSSDEEHNAMKNIEPSLFLHEDSDGNETWGIFFINDDSQLQYHRMSLPIELMREPDLAKKKAADFLFEKKVIAEAEYKKLVIAEPKGKEETYEKKKMEKLENRMNELTQAREDELKKVRIEYFGPSVQHDFKGWKVYPKDHILRENQNICLQLTGSGNLKIVFRGIDGKTASFLLSESELLGIKNNKNDLVTLINTHKTFPGPKNITAQDIERNNTIKREVFKSDLNALIKHCYEECRKVGVEESKIPEGTREIYRALSGVKSDTENATTMKATGAMRAEMFLPDQVSVTILTQKDSGSGEPTTQIVNMTHTELFNFVDDVKKIIEEKIQQDKLSISSKQDLIDKNNNKIAESPPEASTKLKEEVETLEKEKRELMDNLRDHERDLNFLIEEAKKVLPKEALKEGKKQSLPSEVKKNIERGEKLKARSDYLNELIKDCCVISRLRLRELPEETVKIFKVLAGGERNITKDVKAEMLSQDHVKMTITSVPKDIGASPKTRVVDVKYSELLNFVNDIKQLFEDRINVYEQDIAGYQALMAPMNKSIADLPDQNTDSLKRDVKELEASIRDCEDKIELEQADLKRVVEKINNAIPSDDFRKLEQAERPEQSSTMRKGTSG